MDKKRITTLFLIVLADMLGGSAIIPILPIFVVGQFHASPFQAALVISAFYIAQVGASPLLGHLSDRFGRRPILLLSQAGTILSYLLIVLAVPLGTLFDHTGLQVGIAGGLRRECRIDGSRAHSEYWHTASSTDCAFSEHASRAGKHASLNPFWLI